MNFLKKNLSALSGLILLFGSCDRDNSDSKSTTITGKYTLVSYRISNFENTGSTVDDWQGVTPRPYFEFKDNKRFSDNLNGNLREMNYEVKDDKINFEKSLAFETHDSFTYSVTGNTMGLKREDKQQLLNGNTFTESTTITLQKN